MGLSMKVVVGWVQVKRPQTAKTLAITVLMLD